MNLERKNLLAVKGAVRLFFQRRRARLGEVFFGQNDPARLESGKPVMSLLSLFARRAALCFCWGLAVGIPASVFAQTNYYTTNGTEYAIIGSLPGDQVFPDAALNSSGGFVVWQDNITDGSGWGISATRLGPGLSPSLTWWDQKVNIQTNNDQENPRVAMLKNGGAVFVWQGGKQGFQHIFARFLSPTNTFLTTTDVVVSTFASNFQVNPAVAVLNNSNVAVVWASFDQVSSGSMQDVYGQIFSQTGQPIETPNWVYGIMDWSDSPDNTNAQLIACGLIFPYAQQTKIYKCPADQSKVRWGPRVRSVSTLSLTVRMRCGYC